LGPAKVIVVASHSAQLRYYLFLSSGTLVKLHGTFMVTAWMLAASCGLLLARYYKLTWVGKQIMGKDLWFVVS
jgi:hypothetical protein